MKINQIMQTTRIELYIFVFYVLNTADSFQIAYLWEYFKNRIPSNGIYLKMKKKTGKMCI